ncbi:MAG: exodeoxyribonuclease VII large subunit [Bacteroidaceae bacterium]|nr:exodeoxyribonuclease VII large subunit [Bacteroidaceae bacterium]
MEEALTLYELNHLVNIAISRSFQEAIWLQAEVFDVRESHGHCFLEFVQKEEKSGRLIAKSRGQIWAATWAVIRPYFEKVTGQTLTSGLKVLVQVEVTFHEQFGYSLNIIDINPTYTLGDIARRRQEIINTLKEEGVAEMNKELPLPRLMKRIAVISAENAAGWGDFYNQLTNNPHGLAFHVSLFQAVMQGEKVEQSIIGALNRILSEVDRWDVVVIIRGGGATSDLNGFDTLPLAENIAQFPLPIITGIGHERDDTVIDLISHTRVKTPTAAAEFILQHQVNEANLLASYQNALTEVVQATIHNERLRLERQTTKIPTLFGTFREGELHKLEVKQLCLINSVQALLTRNRSTITLSEAKLQANAPERILKLGYSIVRHDGKAVTDARTLSKGDRISITHAEGETTATVD